jgi:hypothetical protein
VLEAPQRAQEKELVAASEHSRSTRTQFTVTTPVACRTSERTERGQLLQCSQEVLEHRRSPQGIDSRRFHMFGQCSKTTYDSSACQSTRPARETLRGGARRDERGKGKGGGKQLVRVREAGRRRRSSKMASAIYHRRSTRAEATVQIELLVVSALIILDQAKYSIRVQ